jgi:hypothetical protein
MAQTHYLDALLKAHGKEPQSIYTIPDAAGIVGMTERALKLMIWRGKIAAVKRSPRRFAGITHDELGRYLAAQNEKGAA